MLNDFMLEEEGLYDISFVGESRCLPVALLPDIVRYVHLYYDLSINREGIGAVKHLLSQIDDLQEEVRRLQNELRFYRSFEEE